MRATRSGLPFRRELRELEWLCHVVDRRVRRPVGLDEAGEKPQVNS